MSGSIDGSKLTQFIQTFWCDCIKPTFEDYVRIPCINLNYVPKKKGPSDAPPGSVSGGDTCYYPNMPGTTTPYSSTTGWQDAMKDAATLAQTWQQSVSDSYGLNAKIIRKDDVSSGGTDVATPMMLVHIPGDSGAGNVLMWGHLDKQTTTGEDGKWTSPAEGPFCPVIEEDKLYGRGTADDGYAMFFMTAAILALKDQGCPCPTFNLLIDFDEESGSQNVKPFLEESDVSELVGTPDLVVTFDSNAGDYDRLWYTVSERGTITGKLSVRVLTDSVHSGDGGGIIPNPIRIAQLLIDRLQDTETGIITPSFLKKRIPKSQLAYARQQADLLGFGVFTGFPWQSPAAPVSAEPLDLILNKTWRAALAITGVDGLPSTDSASNVIIPCVTFMLSIRVPPTVDVNKAQKKVQRLLTADPPYGATVDYSYEGLPIGGGWYFSMESGLKSVVENASLMIFGTDESAEPIGDGGTVPILNTLKEMFNPSGDAGKTQFLATGVAGPGNDEHAANEHLNISYARKVAECVTLVLSELPTLRQLTPAEGVVKKNS